MGHTRVVLKFDILTICKVRYRIQKRNRKQKGAMNAMGPRFDETLRGRKFFDTDIPKLIKAIKENTAELKRANDLKEAELNLNKGDADHGN